MVKLFEDFCLASKILPLENFGPSQAPLEKSFETSKILSQKFLFKGKITEPRIFNPRKF